MSTPIQIPDALTLSADNLSIAVISPDEKRRNAAMSALSKCQTGKIQEFTSYPPGLDNIQRMLGHDFDVIIVDLDSNPTSALDLVESICANDLGDRDGLFGAADADLLVRCMRAGAREFLNRCPSPSAPWPRLWFGPRPFVRQFAPPKRQLDGCWCFSAPKAVPESRPLACNFAVSLAQESQAKNPVDRSQPPAGRRGDQSGNQG
jgi:pilus assembly protein CpaE